ncbi:MAG: cbb3-type cytochrome oxidase assembly protein CcoS [Leptospiraceae bacterium]|nr:cbb3-type cytochrome oxidase assembly protein CcoS [Leptospiraceae bacterium]
MAGLLITLPIAVIIALAFLGFFLWSVRNEDHEDPEMIKYRMLMDEQDQADRSIQQKNHKA